MMGLKFEVGVVELIVLFFLPFYWWTFKRSKFTVVTPRFIAACAVHFISRFLCYFLVLEWLIVLSFDGGFHMPRIGLNAWVSLGLELVFTVLIVETVVNVVPLFNKLRQDLKLQAKPAPVDVAR
jgi:hypothetical protein